MEEQENTVDLASQFSQRFRFAHKKVLAGYTDAAKRRHDGEPSVVYFSRFYPGWAMLVIVLLGAGAALCSGIAHRSLDGIRPYSLIILETIALCMNAAILAVLWLSMRAVRHQRYEGKWQRTVVCMWNDCAEENISRESLMKGLKIRIHYLQQNLGFWAAASAAIGLFITIEGRVFAQDTSLIVRSLSVMMIPNDWLHAAFALLFFFCLSAIFIFAYCPLAWHKNLETVMEQMMKTETNEKV